MRKWASRWSGAIAAGKARRRAQPSPAGATPASKNFHDDKQRGSPDSLSGEGAGGSEGEI
jgi:hypothetical protein